MTLRTSIVLLQATTFLVLAALLVCEGGLLNLRLALAQTLLAVITVAVYV